VRWSVERRLELIEFRLHWEGRLNRRDLIDGFGISAQQASADIARYEELAPGNMAYDTSTKTYVRSKKFKPALIDPTASDYLNELRLVAEGLSQAPWISDALPVGLMPTHARAIDSKRLRDVLSAIRGGEAIEILYQSFSKSDPEWRWIAPHALGFDGIRWHARAWCLRSDMFKDFSLARIQGTRDTKPFPLDPKSDRDWLENVDITVVPDPALSAAQRKAIELEYGMKDGRLKIPVRRAFLTYALRRLGLDVPEEARPAGARRLKLLDRARIAAMAGLSGRETERLAKVL
jgi:predicted DNA-binding transcriptional regulator YafY